MNEPQKNDTAKTDRELLTFHVGRQEYSIDIMSVREIRGWTKPTPLPHSANYVRGVINLRGTVLPIIDLSKRLNIDVTEASERNVIIVSHIQEQTAGLLVDAVSDILAIPETDIKVPPETTAVEGTHFVQSLTIVEGRLLRILDLSAVLPEFPKAVA